MTEDLIKDASEGRQVPRRGRRHAYRPVQSTVRTPDHVCRRERITALVRMGLGIAAAVLVTLAFLYVMQATAPQYPHPTRP